MTHTVRQRLPRLVQIGRETALDLDIYDVASSRLTATAATVTVRLGGEEIVAAAAATTLGPPASYTLPSTATEGRVPHDGWLETWSVTLDGAAHTFQRAGYLVRQLFTPTIIDTDLTYADSDLLSLLPSGVNDLGKYRIKAIEKIQRDLLKKGRRPWLIFDSYDLTDAHVALSLAYAYRDAAIKMGGQTRYMEEYKARLDEYKAEMGDLSFRYDGDEDGTLDEVEETPAAGQGPLLLTAAPQRGRFGHDYGGGW
ncbi:MAG: hypothetical protein AAFV53_00245 [Myxococcota bacterium]